MRDMYTRELPEEMKEIWASAHLMETPRERMDCIERWLKCFVGKTIEVYARHGKDERCYELSGKLLGIERKEAKDLGNLNDPFDVRILTMSIDQGKEGGLKLSFAEDRNKENIGRIRCEGRIIYDHQDVLKEMEKYLKQ